MKFYPRYARLFGAWVLAALGLGLPVAEAAYTCSIDSPNLSNWKLKAPVIYDNLPIGSVILERQVKLNVVFAKTTPGREHYKIAGHWVAQGYVLPSPALALPAFGTATGGGPLKGLGLRHSTQDGRIFYDEQTIAEGSFEEDVHSVPVILLQQIVKVDNTFTQGGQLLDAPWSSLAVGFRPYGICEGISAPSVLFADVPAPVKSTCTLATKSLSIRWPDLLTSEMPLNALSHKRGVDISLTNCVKGTKPSIHFASYRDLARGEVRNPVASLLDGTIIDGLSIRLKNGTDGSDIRFGDPAATHGDPSVAFNIGTAMLDNSSLSQRIDVYLERTKSQLKLGPWVSNASFIVTYP
ncbi:hypothetical protein Q7O60_30390 [Pseudomonas protegens]|uniref:Pilin (Type 1 fimbria component protein) n=1 Tax=Pseudomonas idahonensis TaxID=2942628 RepID=A0ABT5QAE4_9PSED|nr:MULTISPECIES: hypothetical protein [Pseudomonas]MDD1151181.1 hypothetical protein [Pseudomonas idahonensis]MDP9507320.1 hypothetical protein [Pseudomonas protegens]